MFDRTSYPKELKILAAAMAAMSAFFLLLVWLFGSQTVAPLPLGPIGKTLQAHMLDAYVSVGILPEKVTCTDLAKSDFLRVSCRAPYGPMKDLTSWFVAAGWTLEGATASNQTYLTRAGDGLSIGVFGNEMVLSIRRPKGD
ncbi:MAG: hypothetical protein CFE43_21505 [Burkholderiales bacterium PBB3]|nr:MAG: hypothetical protein CFE43_21505 [Burkholderiales bacterium PBB3]